jgi:TP901-1 family phage major tail protein
LIWILITIKQGQKTFAFFAFELILKKHISKINISIKRMKCMSIQQGKALLLKITDGGTGWITVAGLRSRQFSLNTKPVDVTHADSTGAWRELLAGAGVKTCSLSGSGVFRDATSDATLKQVFFDGVIKDYQVIIPDFAVIQGAFLLTALRYQGAFDGEVTFDLSLESAGALTFTAI